MPLLLKTLHSYLCQSPISSYSSGHSSDRLAVLFVAFFIYDIILTRSERTPMHSSALLGPIFILVTLCQTIAIAIEMNDDFMNWPTGLQATLTDVSTWSLFLGHQKMVDGPEVVQATGASCGLIGPVAKMQLALQAPFLCLACLAAYALLFAICAAARKLDLKKELLRVAKNAVTMMATIAAVFLLPFLHAVSAPQHCVSAYDVTTRDKSSIVNVMKSDPTVVCYVESDSAYTGSVYADVVGLMGLGKLLPLGMILLVFAPSDLLGVLSNKYVLSLLLASLFSFRGCMYLEQQL